MPKKRKSEFGVFVKVELVQRGMTSRELARSIGLADSTVCDVLAGRNISVHTKRKIVDALNLPQEALELDIEKR